MKSAAKMVTTVGVIAALLATVAALARWRSKLKAADEKSKNKEAAG